MKRDGLISASVSDMNAKQDIIRSPGGQFRNQAIIGTNQQLFHQPTFPDRNTDLRNTSNCFGQYGVKIE